MPLARADKNLLSLVTSRCSRWMDCNSTRVASLLQARRSKVAAERRKLALPQPSDEIPLAVGRLLVGETERGDQLTPLTDYWPQMEPLTGEMFLRATNASTLPPRASERTFLAPQLGAHRA